jgi:hypothetical protein
LSPLLAFSTYPSRSGPRAVPGEGVGRGAGGEFRGKEERKEAPWGEGEGSTGVGSKEGPDGSGDQDGDGSRGEDGIRVRSFF